MSFNGFSSYINCGTNNRGVTNQVTVEAWIKTTSSAYQWIVGKYYNSLLEEKGYHLAILGGNAYFNGRIGIGQYMSSGASTARIDDGKWHHLAGVCNFSTWQIYVDGVLENSAAFPASQSDLTTSTSLVIGCYDVQSGQYFNGDLDEVRVWRTARTATEIRDNMCRKFATAPASLVAYYRLDQNSGLAAIDNGTVPTNAALLNISGSWHLSGAPLGDASANLYPSTWLAGSKVALGTATGDSAIVSGVSAQARGVHVYAINSAPSIAPPGQSAPPYFGVFTTGTSNATNTYTLRLRPSTGPACRNAFTRISNELAWTLPPQLPATVTSLLVPNALYRGEYIFTQGTAIPASIIGDSVLCAGTSSTQLSAIAPSGASFLWSTGATTATLSNVVPGTYSVTITFAGGCSRVLRRTVQAVPTPTVTITGDSLLCPSTSTLLTAAAPGATGYRWNTGATTATLAVPQAGTYTVTVTYGQGCTTTSRRQVRFIALPSAAIIGDSVLCGNATTQLTVSTTGAATYLWNNGATTATLLNVPAGTYTVTVSFATGCARILRRTVRALPIPAVVITGDSVLCAGATTSLTATANGAVGYLWNTGATTASISGTLPGIYTVTTTFATGCTRVVRRTVRALAVPAIAITGDSTICPGTSTLITATAPGATGYRWSNGATTPGLTISQPGMYTVTVSYGTGCTTSARREVRLNAVPSATITGDSLICAGGTTQLSVATAGSAAYRWSTGATTAAVSVVPGTYSVTLTFSNGCTRLLRRTVRAVPVPALAITGDSVLCAGSSTTLTVVSSGTATFRWSTGATTPGIYNVLPGTYSVTVTYGSGCVRVLQRTVRALGVPSIAISGDSTVCAGNTTTLTATAAGAIAYRWSTGATTASAFIAQPGTYTVTATYGTGCIVSARRTVRLNAIGAPVAFTLGADTTLCEGDQVLLQGPAGAAYRYQWSDGSTNRQLAVQTAGRYTLRVSTACGEQSASRTVAVTSCLKVPNIVTANGDKLNDQFKVQGLKGEGWALDVYDRWGRAVFQTANYHNEWGADAAPGVYYVLLRRPATGFVYKGWLEVLR
ncbi:gliding motility-associated C-terminal domain-containing protein [Microvirga sp. SRT04]|uniref:Gliding motility-associated C-terminal domain-containing protein n=1 Tax=Hymenobacter properus TaxID=2791026 RepID=A0A931FKG6_9BACT|nr:gliding motility-associated C-terminal domain-containing protein [Hymenobacter properus]MBR7722752.1 gliding motility-associated C-terminal domain-containing protein [Microvirga sp. SRT04]